MPSVYLAGPIAGQNYAGCTDWRIAVRKILADVGVTAFSPMRAKAFLARDAVLTKDGYEGNVLSTQRGIMTRDRWDATRCDALFVNLLGAEVVSIGTTMEIAWADAKRIPIVVAMEDQGNPHEHAMIREAIGYRVPSLEQAIYVTTCILNPGD